MNDSASINDVAFERLKLEIDARFVEGRFVAISDGLIVDDAPTLEELLVILRNRGIEPTNVLVVQAGVEQLNEVVILLGNQSA